MDKIETLVHILAWFGLMYSTLGIVVRLLSSYEYSKNELAQRVDRFRGVRRIFPVQKFFLTFIISGAVVIAFW